MNKNIDMCGYVQVAELTDEEQIALYMEHTKREIAEMLLNANKVIGSMCGRSAFADPVSADCGSSSAVLDVSVSTCDDFTEPGRDCAHLCHDCFKGAYCHDSECNENKNI